MEEGRRGGGLLELPATFLVPVILGAVRRWVGRELVLAGLEKIGRPTAGFAAVAVASLRCWILRSTPTKLCQAPIAASYPCSRYTSNG
jgi:hypothetical protein